MRSVRHTFLFAVMITMIFTTLDQAVAQTAVSSQIQPTSEIPEKRFFTLDEKVNPCDDFNQYVCGGVEKSFKLRDDRSSHTFAFDDSDERLLEKKKSFFRNIQNEKKLSARSKQLKSYYMACMNEAESVKEEKALVTSLVKEVDSMKSIKEFLKINFANLTNDKWNVSGYSIIPNIDNPLIYDITFDVSLMGLPEHSYYDNKELISEYALLMAEFFNTIYPKGNKEDHLKRAQAMIDFEKRFKEFYPLPAAFRQRYTQPRRVSREEFFKQTSVLGLEPFFKKHVPAETLIRDFIPESFQFVQKEINETNLAVLKDMYLYRNARAVMDDAYPELYKKRLEFRHKFLGGAPTRPDRQERCTMAVMGSFPQELDLEMLPRIFPEFPREKMVLVAEKVRSAIISGIEKNDWLLPESKEGALRKIKSAKLQLVQPMTDKEWDFSPILVLSEKKRYENSRILTEAGHKRALKKLKEGVNQQAWGMGPLTVNAYYSPDKNKFVMPIGILQYPFFVAEGDVVENLGAVGAVVAHELGHSIDDEGSKFDSDGKLKQWMAEVDVQKFKARGAKMVQQFNKIGHNGELTLGENIADLVGLTFAYNAAFPNNEGARDDKKKFFVSYARVWCSVAREKAKEMQLKTDPHSLGWARINEQVKHQAGFAEAFNCTSKNKLFLKESDRIKIW